MHLIIKLKNFLEIMTHNPRLCALGSTNRSKSLQLNSVLIMPSKNGLEVAAPVVHTKVREGVFLRISPEVAVHVDISIAHEILQEGRDTVADVQTVVGRHPAVVVARRVVVVDVPGKVHADAVQAVDLVKNIDAADVGVWAKAK